MACCCAVNMLHLRIRNKISPFGGVLCGVYGIFNEAWNQNSIHQRFVLLRDDVTNGGAAPLANSVSKKIF
jgi:hypothetical protein